MSSTHTLSVACPSCGTHNRLEVLASVNVTQNPELKDRILSGQLAVLRCTACNARSRIAHPTLYVDMKRSLLVQLHPDGTNDAPEAADLLAKLPSLKTRLVRDGNALIEKVRIDDAELDDRVVECLKAALAVAMPRFDVPWYFEARESTTSGEMLRFTLLTADGPMATRRPRGEYDTLAHDLARAGAFTAELAAFSEVGRTLALAWLNALPAITAAQAE